MPPSPGPQARFRVEGLRPWPPLCEMRKRGSNPGSGVGIRLQLNTGCGLIQRCLVPQAQAVTAEISRNQETSLDVVMPGKAGKK